MVVNGVKPVELSKLVDRVEPVETVDAAVAAPAKPKADRQRKPKADKPAAKPAAKAKAGTQGGQGCGHDRGSERRWIPAPELLEFTGWLPHTLRGYISRVPRLRAGLLSATRLMVLPATESRCRR
jgi:hypothetical protein